MFPNAGNAILDMVHQNVNPTVYQESDEMHIASADFCLIPPRALFCVRYMTTSQNKHNPTFNQEPVQGFEQLLPCALEAIPLRDPAAVAATSNRTVNPDNGIISNSTVADMLGLPRHTKSRDQSNHERTRPSPRQREPIEGGGVRRRRELKSPGTREEEHELAAVGGGHNGGGAGVVDVTRKNGGGGRFDVSVLCTVYRDVNVLFDPDHNDMDPRMAEALLWSVNVSLERCQIRPPGDGDGGARWLAFVPVCVPCAVGVCAM